jgi:exoribonuclease R
MNNTNTGSQRALLQRIARSAMQEKGFLTDFPSSVMSTLNSLQEITPKIAGPVRDLRNLAWCSIDNDDSEDLDQLSVAIPMPSGEVKILVAVADVDSVVNKNSVFEDHANHNTTSVYTSALIFPMLPEKLSTDLTSLKLNADRSSIVVEYVVTGDGSIKNPDIYPAVVRNKAERHCSCQWAGSESQATKRGGKKTESLKIPQWCTQPRNNRSPPGIQRR